MTAKPKQPDPLAGMRQALNEDRLASLLWPDDGGPCPVSVGDEFRLRSCRIAITKTHRIRHKQRRMWRAEFARYVPDRRYFLAQGAGNGRGYVAEEELAQREQGPFEEEPGDGSSPAERAAGLVGGNRRPAPEPEAVPPHEIAGYRPSKEARQRYLREMEERRAQERAEPLPVRIAAITRRAADSHVDISGDLFVIRQRIAKGDLEGAKARVADAETRLDS